MDGDKRWRLYVSRERLRLKWRQVRCFVDGKGSPDRFSMRRNRQYTVVIKQYNEETDTYRVQYVDSSGVPDVGGHPSVYCFMDEKTAVSAVDKLGELKRFAYIQAISTDIAICFVRLNKNDRYK